jgi:hypothetical protein
MLTQDGGIVTDEKPQEGIKNPPPTLPPRYGKREQERGWIKSKRNNKQKSWGNGNNFSTLFSFCCLSFYP